MPFLTNDPKMTSYLSFAFTVLVWWLSTGSLVFALGMIVMLLIHEMGHYYAAIFKGVPVSPPVFTPFGAFILTPPNANAKEEAFVALAGPVAGSVAALIAYLAGVVTNNMMLLQIAHWGFLINLFNLIPLSPLDGGRISMVIERRLWIVGAPLLVLAFFQFGMNMYNMFFFALIGMQAYQDVIQREQQARFNPRYFAVGATTRLQYGAAYGGLALFLIWTYLYPSALYQLLRGFGL